MKIQISDLSKLVEDTLLKRYSADETALIKEVIMFGELEGRTTHGIMRLLPENYGAIVEEISGEPEIISKTKVSTIIKGNGNPAMLVCPMATNEVIKLAKENGFGIVGTNGSTGSSGSLSYYAEKIAKEDLICIICSQASPLVSAFGSKETVFGTNPIAFGFPNTAHPLVFDMSTSAITYGAIKNAVRLGQKLPENVALDENLAKSEIEVNDELIEKIRNLKL
jgi:LDH2 family malate/lactate/ureidoglycolate dehydrogenase